jgi:hypothetical protein
MVFDNAGILTEDERNFVQPQSRLVDATLTPLGTFEGECRSPR